MSYPPAKRQRSNTSRESANGTPQTIPPSLRHTHISQGLSLYPSAAFENGGYPLQPVARQPVGYNHYSPNTVTTPTGGYGGAYQPSTTGYGAGSYSPQQQANTFAPQYASQSPPNGHMAYHNTNFHQQPRPNPATSTIQHQHQHTLADYTESYASQPAPHAAPYNASANSYPDPSILNSHFSPTSLSSPAPIPSPAHLPTPAPQNESRYTPEEDLCEDDEEEDAQGEMADESSEVYTNPEPPRMPAHTSMPTPSAESSSRGEQDMNRCSCKTGRGGKKPCKNCACSKYGLGCTASCSCGDACGNVFADLTQFFGPESAFSKPCGANACFATWLCNQPDIEDLEMDLMIDIMLNDDKSWETIREYTEPFKKWEDSWKKARLGKRKKAKEERERLEFELLRGALGNCNEDSFCGYWYSFCRGKWVPANSCHHCQECGVCLDWHCDKHNHCTRDYVCPGCASAPYPDMMQAYPDPGS